MMTTIVVTKALLEIAALALLGHGALYILAGYKRETNVFYQVLTSMTRPLLKSVRFVTPRFVLDRHIGALAFLVVTVGWFLLLVQNQELCLDNLRHQSCGKLAVEYISRCESGNDQACAVLERNGIMPAPVN